MSQNYPEYPQGSPFPGTPAQPGPYGQGGGQFPGAQPYGGAPAPYGDGGQPFGEGAQPYADPAGYGGGWGGAPAPVKTGLSIAALVLGILAVLSCWVGFFALPVGIAGLVCGIIALTGIKKGTQGGKGLALTGTILSGLGTLVAVVLGVIALVFVNSVADDIDDILASASPTLESSPSVSASASQEPSPSASAPDANVTYTPKDVGQAWTDPATNDTYTVNSYVLGGPSPDDEDSILLGVNMTLVHGLKYYGSDAYAADFEPESSKGWTSGWYTSTLDADVATGVVGDYGLEGATLDPYSSPSKDTELSGWVFYEVPKSASGTWTLNWTRDGFNDDSGGTYEDATMTIEMG